MFLFFSLICILGPNVNFAEAAVNTTEKFDSHELLLAKNNFELFWKHNSTHLTVEIHADTTGYIGFGFSKDGSMVPADVILAWVANSRGHLYDYHTTDHTPPVLDQSQDWKLMYAIEANGKTAIKATRQLTTHDSTNDLPITQGGMHVIFAYKDQDPPTSGTLTFNDYHDENKGTKTIQLLSSAAIPVGK